MYARGFTTPGRAASERTSLISSSSSENDHKVADTYKVLQEEETILPHEISPRYQSIFHQKGTKYNCLEESIDTQITKYEADNIWLLNYNEAAIYLEEGENNEKLDFHPRNTKSLSSYRFVHNQTFYVFDLVACLILLSLSLLEPPSVNHFGIPLTAQIVIELTCLTVISIESWMKLKWMGLHSCAKHPRTVIKVSIMVIMIIDAIVTLSVSRSDYRITRALRPIFLIDNHFCNQTRRSFRHFLFSLRPIVDIVIILLFIMTAFAVAGHFIFSKFEGNQYFNSIGDSFANLFIVISNGNFPDIMMPVYAENKWCCLFFITYLVIQLYFVMNMMLAVSYEQYSKVQKEKFRRLYMHRRICARKAFKLLNSERSTTTITFKNFEGVVRIILPGVSRLRCYLIFKHCDLNRSGVLNQKEFYRVYESLELNWTQMYPEVRWYSFSRTLWNCFDPLTRFAKGQVSTKAMDFVLTLALVYELMKTSELVPGIQFEDEWVYSCFIGTFLTEAVIKIIGLGLFDYLSSGWNCFDISVTIVSVVGHYIRPFGYTFGFFYILRTFEILRLFERTKRYNHIMGPFVFMIIRQLTHFSVIVFVVLYSYSHIGIQLFANVDHENPPPIEMKTMADLYTLNNFSDIISSFMTLFVLMFGYTWFFLMDRYAKLVGSWSRVYFMSFYIISTVILTILISSILEAFSFTMKCKRKLSDIEDMININRVVMLSQDELLFLGLITEEEIRKREETSQEKFRAMFRGTKLRTKFSFWCKMYANEIGDWIEEDESHVIQRTPLRFRHRAHTKA